MTRRKHVISGHHVICHGSNQTPVSHPDLPCILYVIMSDLQNSIVTNEYTKDNFCNDNLTT